jgi:hypothetical protein
MVNTALNVVAYFTRAFQNLFLYILRGIAELIDCFAKRLSERGNTLGSKKQKVDNENQKNLTHRHATNLAV